MKKLFGGIYSGKKILLTGHTGFKGSWLALWLTQMGAEVYGYSLPAPTKPAHWDLLKMTGKGQLSDIRDKKKLEEAFQSFKPDMVFHLAAQALVRLSYKEPFETFETNVMGSFNVYEAAKKCPSVKVIVSITTDKVYDNKEWTWGYRENEALGGKDPYSASKAAMEIMTASYRHSYFHPEKLNEHGILLATARAGNVIGGGDWALDRLIPDMIVGASEKRTAIIRSPKSTRPWQHVLEPLSGYLLLGQRLWERQVVHADAYNFGPEMLEEVPVLEAVEKMQKHWDAIKFEVNPPKNAPHEAGMLKLDCTKAFSMLHWHPVWNVENAIEETITWYKNYYTKNGQVDSLSNLKKYVESAKSQGIVWA